VSHSRKPRVEVVVRGFHCEWESNFDGLALPKVVEDWSCRMDISGACCDRWAFITAAGGLSFDAAISEFCLSGAPVKSLAMDSVVDWNWDELQTALERLVISTGWNGKFSVSFPIDSSSCVGIISSNRSTRFVTNAAVRGQYNATYSSAVSFCFSLSAHSCFLHRQARVP